MSEKKGLLKKLKGIKNIEIVIALVLASIVLLVFFGSFGQNSTNQQNSLYSFAEYVNNLENKIKSVISKIDGAGECEVAISFVGGIEQEYVFSDEKQQTGDSVTQKNTLTLVSGKPVVLREKIPEVFVVVIVADGADKMSVKLEITRAVQALIKVPDGNIEVFKRS